MTLWRESTRFDPSRGVFATWLLTLIHHRAVDAMRKESTRRRRLVAESEAGETGRQRRCRAPTTVRPATHLAGPDPRRRGRLPARRLHRRLPGRGPARRGGLHPAPGWPAIGPGHAVRAGGPHCPAALWHDRRPTAHPGGDRPRLRAHPGTDPADRGHDDDQAAPPRAFTGPPRLPRLAILGKRDAGLSRPGVCVSRDNMNETRSSGVDPRRAAPNEPGSSIPECNIS